MRLQSSFPKDEKGDDWLVISFFSGYSKELLSIISLIPSPEFLLRNGDDLPSNPLQFQAFFPASLCAALVTALAILYWPASGLLRGL